MITSVVNNKISMLSKKYKTKNDKTCVCVCVYVCMYACKVFPNTRKIIEQ